MTATLHSKPVYPNYFADPFVWQHDGVYYAIGTGVLDARGEASHASESLTLDGKAGVFQILRSEDLFHWSPIASAMERLAPEYGDSYWAPEIACAGGQFYLYYSVGFGDKSHHLRVAVADNPAGPYRDAGRRVTDLFTCPFAIDASPFQDDDGQWFLFYSRDFLDSDEGARPGTALVVDRLVNMTQLAGEERVVMRAHYDWQRFLSDRVMYGARYDWHTLEGPSVVKRDGRYYCFYSAGRWENETYGVDYAVADCVMGPYSSDVSESGARVLRTVPGKVIGPGHNSIVRGPDGSTDYIVYHAWDPGMIARRMFVSPIQWTAGGPTLR
jgi:beta-xylosidase